VPLIRPAVRWLLSVAALAVLFEPAVVAAHIGGEPFIHVPAGQITPGQDFHLVAADLGPNATVKIELRTDGSSLPIGAVVAGSDGHFEADLALPAGAPTGYRQLVAQSDDGSLAATWIMVASGPPGDATAPGQSAPLVDPSLLLLLAVAVGGAAFWAIRRLRAVSR
jgi:hypothetical protein